MATLKLHPTLTDDLRPNLVQQIEGFLDNGLALTALSTQLRLTVLSEHLVLRGAGLTYSYDGLALTGVTGGVITQIEHYDLLNLRLSVTGLNVSATALFSAIQSNHWAAANALLWGGNDLMHLSNNDDQMNGFAGNDTIYGYGGNDTLSGAGGRDQLYGGSGHDKLHGGNGADSFYGETGNDTLIGGKGADLLVGGTGKDRLTGGAGADTFAFAEVAAGHHDVITDFHSREDRIQLDASAFSGFGYAGKLRSADFVQGSAAKDSTDRVIYQQSTGKLWYDADGSGTTAKVLIAELGPGTELLASDVLLV